MVAVGIGAAEAFVVMKIAASAVVRALAAVQEQPEQASQQTCPPSCRCPAASWWG